MSSILNSSDSFRENTVKRNSYSSNNEYSIDNTFVGGVSNRISDLLFPTSSFDFSNTLIGRLTEPQTPITKIGNEQLQKMLSDRIASNAKTQFVPTINLGNILNGKPIIQPNIDYRITVENSVGGILDVANRLVGNNQESGNNVVFQDLGTKSGFASENIVKNTGKGQKQFLENLLSSNPYYPLYDGIDIKKGTTQTQQLPKLINIDLSFIDKIKKPNPIQETPKKPNDNEYGGVAVTNFDPAVVNIPDGFGKTSKTNNTVTNEDHGFGVDQTTEYDYFLGSNSSFDIRKGLLNHSYELQKSLDKNSMMRKDGNGILTTESGGIFYNGSADGRTFSKEFEYDRYERAIRYKGNGKEYSVAKNFTVPKIHPILDKNSGKPDNSHLMFSIENLAFKVSKTGNVEGNTNLTIPLCEVGDNGGRLMWFPPYDISVNETVSSKHETVEMIGRGEPMYTYSNTERSATLSFKLIIDYPPNVNGKTGFKDMATFFAFGEDNDFSPKSNLQAANILLKRKDELIESKPKPYERKTILPKNVTDVVYYFRNDSDEIDTTYEEFNSDSYSPARLGVNNEIYYGLNSTFVSDANTFAQELINLYNNDELKYYEILGEGFASQLFTNDYNKALSARRGASLLSYVEEIFTNTTGVSFADLGITTSAISAYGEEVASADGAAASNMNNRGVKIDRRASLKVIFVGGVEDEIIEQNPDDYLASLEIDEEIKQIDDQLNKFRQITHCVYEPPYPGDTLKSGWANSVANKYLSTFHSQTPEDFHRRLTFLHQCTRQGVPIISDYNGKKYNSVFGRQPVCILRLGDMFHTKIIIETMNIDYNESLWDLNPEGMGVQYMMADITLNIKIIGGMSLATPIRALQNAISFNYYGNSTYYNDDVYQVASQRENEELKRIGVVKGS